MPQFILDTNGHVAPLDPSDAVLHSAPGYTWGALDTFTGAYIEALFFTESGDNELEGLGFADLAPETLARIIADCEAFQATPAYRTIREAEDNEELGDLFEGHGGVSTMGGHDFWLTRNGHGAGFWDGDWPEPHATALDAAAEGFGNVDAYVGDDGKVYLS